jgi:hypothetical protein
MEAVQCGVEIQQAMAARNAETPDERKMLVRIGINVDDVMRKDDDISVTASTSPLACGIGGTRRHLHFPRVHDQLRDKSPFLFEDQGKHAVKNIARPVHVFIVRFDGAPDAVVSTGAAAPATDVVLIETESNGETASETELAFWSSIASSESTADYEAYLERYPTGHFDVLARARLATLTTAPPVGSDAEVKLQLIYWESVKDSDDPAMLSAYLEKYPEGHFKEPAARLVSRERAASPAPTRTADAAPPLSRWRRPRHPTLGDDLFALPC